MAVKLSEKSKPPCVTVRGVIMQVAREIVLAKERHGAAVAVQDITINSRPASYVALKSLLDTCHTLSVATGAFPAAAQAQQDDQPGAEVSISCVLQLVPSPHQNTAPSDEVTVFYQDTDHILYQDVVYACQFM
ncbi:MAG: hypothetical protein HC767_06790 [Akkermansiaceae bacterium]|nr:hypothetical protein [Akkermansiaceae bacterium]